MSRTTLAVSLAVATGLILTGSAAFADGYGNRSLKDSGPYDAPSSYSWTGMYLGVNAGFAWGTSDLASSMSCTSPGNCPFNSQSSFSSIGASGSGSVDTEGFTGGVQAGYNIQAGNVVYGFELDFNSLDLGSSRTVSGVTPLGTAYRVTNSVAADWLMTARARLGWTLTPNTLAYITGGLALTDLEAGTSFSDSSLVPPTSGSSTTSDLKAGWTVGGGMEVALADRWTLKGEYLYVDFGKVGTTALVNNVPNVGNASNALTGSSDLTAHIARVGLNYKF